MPACAKQNAAKPVSDDELAGLFGWLDGYFPLTLAVSGGADSMALMILLARWLELRRRGRAISQRLPGTAAVLRPSRRQIAVVSVDHGLRAEAAQEAAFVKAEAGALGFYHETLVWQGEKPRTGLQAAARAARYRLIGLFHRRHWQDAGALSPGAMVTAHHQDDQAETLLMRLARGSGVDGLAGMAARSRAEAAEGAEGVVLLRPLLDLAKVRLIASLDAAAAAFVEDPSNHNSDFERVRLRAARAGLEAAGLRNDKLALSARRLCDLREGLDFAVREFARWCGLDHHQGAYASLDMASFAAAPRAIRVRLLQRLIALHGGCGTRPRLAKVEVLADRLAACRLPDQAGPVAWLPMASLGGCLIAGKKELQLYREIGRSGHGPAELQLNPGERRVWDRRFEVGLSPAAQRAMTVRRLDRDSFLRLRAGFVEPFSWPARAASGLPAFWCNGELVAVPQLAAFNAALLPRDDERKPLVEARFIDDWG